MQLETQQGELPVLPLSIKGACAMASLPGVEGYMSGDQFFIYLFDPQQSGLSGLSFDEGRSVGICCIGDLSFIFIAESPEHFIRIPGCRFGVFGYITKGLDDTVTKLTAGDRLVQARITSGSDKLVNT